MADDKNLENQNTSNDQGDNPQGAAQENDSTQTFGTSSSGSQHSIKDLLNEQKSIYQERKKADGSDADSDKGGHEQQKDDSNDETGTDLVAKQSSDIEDAKKSGAKSQRMPIGQRLISKNLITEDQLDIALKIQRDSKKNTMLGQILVEMGLLTENTLAEILAEESGVKRFDLKKSVIDPSLVKQVPKDIAIRYKSVPILLEEGQIYVAMTDVFNVLALDRIRRYFPKRFNLVPVHSSEKDLNELINNYYDYELSVDGILREMEALSNESTKELVKNANDQDSYVNPTVRLIDALLIDAIQRGASDLHFEPEGQFIRLRYRVDGRLRLVRSFHKDYWPAIVVRMKIMSDMNITETRNPQDGRITMNILGREVSFRVATQPTIHGENIVLRVLDKQKALLPLAQLGFSESNIKTLHKALQRPEGIIVVTGPTGSGKSTTLYSILSYINKMEVNIMTLEDPVEYSLPMIRQSNIRANSGMDFASGVKSLLRQDPDIIFVGEVRDEGTATMAIRAAMTGHQVYTSLHTNDAIGAIARLIDIGVSPRIVSGNVICVIAQRLARKLCSSCKKERPANEKECKIIGCSEEDAPLLYERKGCEKCDYTGYKGRVAISEILLVNDEIDDLIYKESSKGDIYKVVMKSDFVPMADDGVDKVLQGVTDMEEVIRTIDMTKRF
jgi:general secretion pathway protein E/type IV pilus assembly protein PilB